MDIWSLNVITHYSDTIVTDIDRSQNIVIIEIISKKHKGGFLFLIFGRNGNRAAVYSQGNPPQGTDTQAMIFRIARSL